MSISEILKLEIQNTNVLLHKEGIFWRAYERSAFLFIKNIKEYQLTKKFYKNVNQEIVYLGFPQTSFSNIEELCKSLKLSIKKKENQIIITGIEQSKINSFNDWKKEIPIYQNSKTFPKLALENKIAGKIRNFSVVSKTPIECQQFIIELQNELNLLECGFKSTLSLNYAYGELCRATCL